MANIVEEDRNIKIIIKDEIIFFEIDMILMTQNINELIYKKTKSLKLNSFTRFRYFEI
jgi:hypothetical protein